MDEDSPYNIIYNPDGIPSVAYDISGRFVPASDINYRIDYSKIPNVRDRKFVKDYLNSIRTTYQGANSLLGINLYRDLSNLNNIAGDKEQKNTELRNIKNNVVRIAKEVKNNFDREQKFVDLFGGELEGSFVDTDGEMLSLAYIEPEGSRVPMETYQNMLDRIVVPTRRRIGDNRIINQNMETFTTQRERDAVRRLQSAVRRLNSLA
jgi:hypothetical protein